jgi:hypothetical protein
MDIVIAGFRPAPRQTVVAREVIATASFRLVEQPGTFLKERGLFARDVDIFIKAADLGNLEHKLNNNDLARRYKNAGITMISSRDPDGAIDDFEGRATFVLGFVQENTSWASAGWSTGVDVILLRDSVPLKSVDIGRVGSGPHSINESSSVDIQRELSNHIFAAATGAQFIINADRFAKY